MQRYKKSDVQFHVDGTCGPVFPAVNVKVHNLNYHRQIVKEFKCSKSDAEKALNFAWEIAQDQFWNCAIQNIATECLGSHAEALAAGRSNGWVIVRNLDYWEQWDAIALMKWHCFEKAVKAEVDYLTSWEGMKESIEVWFSLPPDEK